MGNLGGLELLVILLVALVVLGPEKLPDAVRKAGNMVGELRRVSKSFQDEMRSAAMLDDASVETQARERGDQLVADSKAKQAAMEPTGRPLDPNADNTEPLVNREPVNGAADEAEEPEEAADVSDYRPAEPTASADPTVESDS